jgi:DNA polymerase-1
MSTQIALFDDPIPKLRGKTVVTNSASFAKMVQFFQRQKAIAFDFETTGLDHFQGSHAIGLALGAFDEAGRTQVYYTPFRHTGRTPHLAMDQVGPFFRDLLADPSIVKIAHNIKFDAHVAAREGWPVLGPRYDTMIAAHFFDENRSAALKTRAVTDLQIRNAGEFEGLVNGRIFNLAKGRSMTPTAYKGKYGYSEVPLAVLGPYACFDADYTLRLYQKYQAANIAASYPRVWNTEMELTAALGDMESWGLLVDRPYLEQLRDTLAATRGQLSKSMDHQLGGKGFNYASDDETRDFLVTRLKLPLTKKTEKGQFSVDAGVLQEFGSQHPVLMTLAQWREVQKLESTYTTSILDRADAQDIVHPDFRQMGTTTGRMSCSRPNFQNFPRDDGDRAKDAAGIDPWSIRRAFINRGPGWVRLFWDYSQIELRVLAFYSRDPILVQAYLHGEDIHKRTSQEVFGSEDASNRRLSKVINFGLSYGMAAKGFSEQTGIPVMQAQEFLDRFFLRYRGVDRFRNDLWARLRNSDGQFCNLFGRPRRVLGFSSRDIWEVRSAERRSIAALIQGTAAELTKESLVRLSRIFCERQYPAYLCNTVHDEIQIDCRVEALVDVCQVVREEMQRFPEFAPIPILVDGDYTITSWAEKTKLPKA